jgi:ABC-type amino acid transport substrate-binding protein
VLVSALVGAPVLAGCGTDLPRDPEGTLDRVRGGTLRVGVSANPPWTEAPATTAGGDATPAEPPTGIEPDLLTDFAESLGAEVHWTTGGEGRLVADLRDGRLDVVVGGLTDTSPWTSHAALTRPYVVVPGPDGEPEPHVMASALGENALLVALELFLLEQDVEDELAGDEPGDEPGAQP